MMSDSKVEWTSTIAQRVLHQYLEAINDNGVAEAAEQVMERQRCFAKASVFPGFVCACTASFPKWPNCQTKLGEDVQQSVGKPYVPDM